jgi:hypothetical protein
MRSNAQLQKWIDEQAQNGLDSWQDFQAFIERGGDGFLLEALRRLKAKGYSDWQRNLSLLCSIFSGTVWYRGPDRPPGLPRRTCQRKAGVLRRAADSLRQGVGPSRLRRALDNAEGVLRGIEFLPYCGRAYLRELADRVAARRAGRGDQALPADLKDFAERLEKVAMHPRHSPSWLTWLLDAEWKARLRRKSRRPGRGRPPDWSGTRPREAYNGLATLLVAELFKSRLGAPWWDMVTRLVAAADPGGDTEAAARHGQRYRKLLGHGPWAGPELFRLYEEACRRRNLWDFGEVLDPREEERRRRRATEFVMNRMRFLNLSPQGYGVSIVGPRLNHLLGRNSECISILSAEATETLNRRWLASRTDFPVDLTRPRPKDRIKFVEILLVEGRGFQSERDPAEPQTDTLAQQEERNQGARFLLLNGIRMSLEAALEHVSARTSERFNVWCTECGDRGPEGLASTLLKWLRTHGDRGGRYGFAFLLEHDTLWKVISGHRSEWLSAFERSGTWSGARTSLGL